MDKILDALLLTHPLPQNLEIIPAVTMPPARASVFQDTAFATLSSVLEDSSFYWVTVKCNKRITSEDWYQDVRHLEFDFDREIQHVMAYRRPLDLLLIC